jgi:hypothetical protein
MLSLLSSVESPNAQPHKNETQDLT